MITSGLVLSDDVKWISFHRCVLDRLPHLEFESLELMRNLFSGYDFGYFLKLLTNESLPIMEDEFFDLLNLWFTAVFDIKVMTRATKILKGGLQDIADDLGVSRSPLFPDPDS